MMKLFALIGEMLFPPKCVLCGAVLERSELDLCRNCRVEAPLFPKPRGKRTFLDGWTALWYYSGYVRRSLLRYKFHNVRSHADAYGRMLAMKIREDLEEEFDILTWIPISPLRRLRRGYDQVELLACAVGAQLEMEPVRLLKKVRHNRPQSRIRGEAQRRANVLGAYRVTDSALIADKRVLLLDDIITTGATASEAARVLLTAGAKEVYFAAVAAADHNNTNKKTSR